MIPELTRETQAGIEDPLVELRRLGLLQSPTRSVPDQKLAVVVLEPIHSARSDQRPGAPDPHQLGISRGVPLMVVEIGQSGRVSEGLLPVPHAHVVRVRPDHHEQSRAERLIPMCRGAQLVVWREREARGNLTAAIRAIGDAKAGQIGDARKGLAIMLRGAVEPRGQETSVRTAPVAADRIAPNAGSVGLIRCSVAACLVEAVAPDEEAQ